MTEDAALPDRLDALDSEGGGRVFEAFNAMQTTKQRHFALLSRLDEKRSRYGLAPTPRERALLEALLADHDAQVKRFTRASVALKSADPEAHRAVFAYVAALDEASDAAEVRH